MTAKRGSRNVPGPETLRGHWEKAQRYRDVAKASLDAGKHDPAVSNAAIACINLADVLLLHAVDLV